MITVALVGCGKAKADRPMRARDLYTGTLFRAARVFAERCDEWRILSALYCVVDPTKVIAPYDYKVGPKDRQQWGQSAANRIVREFMNGEPYEIVLLAGADYAEPIRESMRFGGGWRLNCVDVRLPLAGLGIGQRMAWFANERRAASEVTDAVA